VRAEAEADAAVPDAVAPVEPPGAALGRAVEHLVLALPPMERACVLLKDVFDYSLDDIATLVDSTVGGVKAALSRGRGKLATAPARMPARKPRTPEIEQLLRLYVERFNQQDWDGLRTLIAADARLRVADAFAGPLATSPYFGKYATVEVPWRMAAGEVDGEPAVIILHRVDDRWIPRSAAMLELTDGRVSRIADFWHITWLLDAADTVVIW
jgi:RNA polymerase sigma-70 factor, ECF subfamily